MTNQERARRAAITAVALFQFDGATLPSEVDPDQDNLETAVRRWRGLAEDAGRECAAGRSPPLATANGGRTDAFGRCQHG